MINAILHGIMWLVLKLAEVITAPIILLVSQLLGSGFQVLLVNVVNYLESIYTYVPAVLRLLMIPREPILIYFEFLFAYYAFYLGGRAYLLVMNIYNKFKL